MTTKRAKCPACKNNIELDTKIRVQGLITCPHCQSLLEFIRDFPPKLDWAEDPVVSTNHRMRNYHQ